MKQLIIQFLSTIKRYALSSVLNVLGLSIAFASFYLIMVQVGYELTFNKNITDYDHIYSFQVKGAIGSDKYVPVICRPFADAMFGANPQIARYGALQINEDGLILHANTDKSENIVVKSARITDQAHQVFAFEVIQGDLEELSRNPGTTIAISRKMAEAFGLDLGSELYAYDVQGFRKVVAIFADSQGGSEVEGVESIIHTGQEDRDNPNNWNYSYFIKTNKSLTEDEMVEMQDDATNALIDFGMQQWGVTQEEAQAQLANLSLRFLPLKDIYFDENQELGGISIPRGNWRMTMLLLSVAIAVLIIAMINYINFFFALVPFRIRSVNTHKIFGCSRPKLIASFVVEAVGVTLLALALAVIIVLIVQQSFVNAFFVVSTAFAMHTSLCLFVVLIALLLSFAVGILLARYITQFPTAMTLKGHFGASKSGKALRAVLVGVQFVATMTLLIYTFFTKLQYDYMMSYDNGFKTTDIISTYLPGSLTYDVANRDAFSNQLKANTDILDVCYASGNMVGSSRMIWTREYKNKEIRSVVLPVCANFIDFMGLHIVEGRSTQPSDEKTKGGVFLFNQTAQKKYEIEVGDNMSAIEGNKAQIKGIVKDFTHAHLRYAVEPMCFYVFGEEKWQMPNHLYVRLRPGASVESVTNYIKGKTEEYASDFSSRYMDFRFFDEELGVVYQAEKQLTDMFTVFALVAILISLLGVFGLVFFEAQYREQEIVIRRIHGASISSILWMFNKRFVYIIALCFLIAAPLSAFLVNHWLSNFANRVDMSPLVFLAALLIVVSITFVIVTIRSYRTASINPAALIRKNN